MHCSRCSAISRAAARSRPGSNGIILPRAPVYGKNCALKRAGKPRSKRYCASGLARLRAGFKDPCRIRGERAARQTGVLCALVPGSFPSGPLAGFQPLIEKVQADDPAVRAALTEALHHVLSAEDFERAWSARSQLPAGGVFVMPAGHQISRAGVQLYAADSEQAGVLARAQEIERLERQARAQRARVDAASTRAAEAEAAQQAARRTLADLSAQYEKAVARAHALQLETQQCAQAHQSAAKRRAHLDEELLELDAHISAQRARIDEYAAHLEQADGQPAQLKKRSDEAKSAFDALDAGQAQARRRARASERAALEAQYAARAAQHRIDELGRAIQAANAQLERTQATLEQTRAELDALDPVAPKQRLDA